MKKTILSLALIISGFFAFGAAAQQPCCNNGQQACGKDKQECCQAPGKPGKAPKANPLEGITLTEQQQAKVQQLNEKYAQMRKDRKEAKKENARKERKEAKDYRKEYLNEMKQILTPEQYTTYLENLALEKKAPKAGKEAKARKAGKLKGEGRKIERKGPRPDGKMKKEMKQAEPAAK